MKEIKPNSTFFTFNSPVIDPTLPKVFEVRGHSWVNYGDNNLEPTVTTN